MARAYSRDQASRSRTEWNRKRAISPFVILRYTSPVSADFSPELLLVAACCIWPPSEVRELLITERSRHISDWGHFENLATRHRVIGLVYDGLRRSPAGVPTDILRTLASASSRQTFASLKLASEAHRVTINLERAGVAVVVLKGAALTVHAFGDLGLRHSKDIDLLVAPEQLDQSVAVIKAAGYVRTEPAEDWGQSDLDSWRRNRKHFEYTNVSRGTWLELHWRLVDNPEMSQTPFPFEAVLRVPVAPGISLPTLPSQELMPYLLLHGATHGWFRLKWLADVSALLAGMSSPERRGIIERAYKDGLDRPTLQGFELCRMLFGLDVPEAPNAEVVTLLLVRFALQAIAAREPEGSIVASLRIVLQRYFLKRTAGYRSAQIKLDCSPRSKPSGYRNQSYYLGARFREWIRRRSSSKGN